VQVEDPDTSPRVFRRDWWRYWGPVFIWGAVIWVLSTKLFSDSNTEKIIVPILHWVFHDASHRTLMRLHHLIRKGAHALEYFIFSLLLLSGIRRGRPDWRLSWGLAAVSIAACWAGLDELHQVFVPNRGPSPRDVLIDIFGAIGGQVFEWRRHRKGQQTNLSV